MNVLVLDNMVDAAGTLATAHTPLIGGAITAQSTAAAKITANNRMRGDAQGTMVYANLPASGNYTIEADIYVASNDHGVGVSLSGILLSYTISNGEWNLGGPGVVTGAPQYVANYNAGETHKIKIVSLNNVLTCYFDGVQGIQKTATQAVAAGPIGFFFLGQDTDGTGYQLESFTAYEVPGGGAVDLDGLMLVDGGSQLFVGSDNEIYLLGLIDLLTSTYIRTATVAAAVTQLDGTSVGTASLAFVSGSLTVNQPNGITHTVADGNYRGALPASLGLVDGTTYLVTVTATSGSNVRKFRAALTAGYSTE